jgi:hypothetical protein
MISLFYVFMIKALFVSYDYNAKENCCIFFFSQHGPCIKLIWLIIIEYHNFILVWMESYIGTGYVHKFLSFFLPLTCIMVRCRN